MKTHEVFRRMKPAVVVGSLWRTQSRWASGQLRQFWHLKHCFFHSKRIRNSCLRIYYQTYIFIYIYLQYKVSRYPRIWRNLSPVPRKYVKITCFSCLYDCICFRHCLFMCSGNVFLRVEGFLLSCSWIPELTMNPGCPPSVITGNEVLLPAGPVRLCTGWSNCGGQQYVDRRKGFTLSVCDIFWNLKKKTQFTSSINKR